MRRVRGLLVSLVFVVLLVGGSAAGLAFADLQPQLGLDLVGGLRVVLTAPEGTDPGIMERTLETIRSRVDAFGVAEPEIAIVGDRNIEVQIPGFQTEVGGAQRQNRLIELIGTTARLEQREVIEAIPKPAEDAPAEARQAYEDAKLTCPNVERDTPECTADALAAREVVFLGADDDETKYRLGPVAVTGEAIRRAVARLSTDQGGSAVGGWEIAFTLTDEGRDRFAEVTQRLAPAAEGQPGGQLAIVLDRRVESAPSVNEAITGGEGVITGDFTEAEAKNLALTLQSGALPVELDRSQLETVSPTLGRESLEQGLAAGIAGVVLLALYLAFYYRLLGIVTWVGMVVWGLLAITIVALAGRWLGYSLTLAGVAGLVVSIGIAGDSYIVFYERLKDEVRGGKTPRVAVQPAFKRAWKTIVAGNLVTILAAVVLYLLAIGSVRGFALTLGVSTALDMFVVWFYKRPAVFLLARSRRLSELRAFGLRAGIAADRVPAPVAGASR